MDRRFKDEIIVCSEAKLAWFDAHNQIAVVSGLFTIGDDGAPETSLARTWYWENHATVSIALGKDRIFSNGRSVTATAICCNLERAMKGTAKAIFNTGEFRIIRRVEATRTYHLRVQLDHPLVPLLGLFSNGSGIVDPGCGESPLNTIGTGAFRIATMNSRAVHLASVDGKGVSVDWRFCTRSDVRAQRILSGEADILAGGQGSRPASDAGWTSVKQAVSSPMHLAFNLRLWPTSHPGFRRAVAETIN